MSSPKYQQLRNKYHHSIAETTRALRASRRLTQAELAAHLGISQGRLSQIERGDGSLTAEQFLVLLQLFNVGVSHFRADPLRHEDDVQNALARLGAAHLSESDDAVPNEALEDLPRLVREVLVSGNPRHIAALAPVLVRQLNRVGLQRMLAEARAVNPHHRVDWLLDNVLTAVRAEAPTASRPWASRYRRAEFLLSTLLEVSNARRIREGAVADEPLDVLDPTINTTRSRDHVYAEASDISRRWRIVTRLQPEDFSQALRAAR